MTVCETPEFREYLREQMEDDERIERRMSEGSVADALADPVTCSECLYCAAPKSTLWCAKFGAYKPSADGFCAWGERRRA